jgi:hypothetical protein
VGLMTHTHKLHTIRKISSYQAAVGSLQRLLLGQPKPARWTVPKWRMTLLPAKLLELLLARVIRSCLRGTAGSVNLCDVLWASRPS